MTENRHCFATVAEGSYLCCLGLCHISCKYIQCHTMTCFSPVYKTPSSSQKITNRPSFRSANSDILFHSVLGVVSFTSSHFQSTWSLCWLLGLKCFVSLLFPHFGSGPWIDKLMNFGIKTSSSRQACHNSQVRATHSALLRLAGMRETGTSLSCFEPF